tara:strand:- start:125 stop:835 length:711 start_codon:yes stop_codon:yes gene_type:complete
MITGALGGIGSAISNIFFKNNYNLILTASTDEKINILKEKYGDNHNYFKLNLLDTDQTAESLDKISKNFKNISILINNAGMTSDNLILRMKMEQWSNVIKTNLDSNFLIIKSLLPNMISNKNGKIIGISSVVATTGNPGQSNYVASKSGLIGLYKSIANEVASRNINVNIVSPGYIITPMTDNLSDDQKNNILNKIPMKKFGTPEDIANIVYFLSSESASYITGQNINVNGGMLMV